MALYLDVLRDYNNFIMNYRENEYELVIVYIIGIKAKNSYSGSSVIIVDFECLV